LRPAILSVIVFFIAGLAILFFVNVARAIRESGRAAVAATAPVSA
jgi:uncharacterized integral membrane protein